MERDFTADAPNRLWVADLTRLLTGEGVLCRASVRDAFSNRIVSWATAARADTLNHRPRKTLGWKTPAEALDEHLQSLQQPGVATSG